MFAVTAGRAVFEHTRQRALSRRNLPIGETGVSTRIDGDRPPRGVFEKPVALPRLRDGLFRVGAEPQGVDTNQTAARRRAESCDFARCSDGFLPFARRMQQPFEQHARGDVAGRVGAVRIGRQSDLQYAVPLAERTAPQRNGQAAARRTDRVEIVFGDTQFGSARAVVEHQRAVEVTRFVARHDRTADGQFLADDDGFRMEKCVQRGDRDVRRRSVGRRIGHVETVAASARQAAQGEQRDDDRPFHSLIVRSTNLSIPGNRGCRRGRSWRSIGRRWPSPSVWRGRRCRVPRARASAGRWRRRPRRSTGRC